MDSLRIAVSMTAFARRHRRRSSGNRGGAAEIRPVLPPVPGNDVVGGREGKAPVVEVAVQHRPGSRPCGVEARHYRPQGISSDRVGGCGGNHAIPRAGCGDRRRVGRMQRALPPHPAGPARRHAPRTFRADLRLDPARGGRLFHTLNADANMAALQGYVMGLCHGRRAGRCVSVTRRRVRTSSATGRNTHGSSGRPPRARPRGRVLRS